MMGLLLTPDYKSEERIIRVYNAESSRVVRLPLETYLRYVVPAEVGDDWLLDALVAAAIAARSYATYTLEKPRHLEVDANVCMGTHCQAFDADKQTKRTNDAVLLSNKMIMTYKGKVVDALYSSCCGGHTFDNEDVFKGGEPLPYLRGVECVCDGKKNGHGVGMCQLGAKKMAEQGASYVEILLHYYGGIGSEKLSRHS